jgi:hypothetical protein
MRARLLSNLLKRRVLIVLVLIFAILGGSVVYAQAGRITTTYRTSTVVYGTITQTIGDTTVTFTTATTFTKTSIATLDDVVRGACIFATGQKDTAGAVTATTVLISPRAATGCPARGFGPNPGAGASPAPGESPRPSPTARPSGAANAAFVSGEVTAVSGLSITVLTQANASETITVASAASITARAAVTASALQDGECVRANGSKDSAGDIQATAITITPAGPSGACTTGLGGRGGGGFPGGGSSGSGG